VRILTTVLEVSAVVLLVSAAAVAFGLAGALASGGALCLTASYVISRGRA
jgi:hypothetical protein